MSSIKDKLSGMSTIQINEKVRDLECNKYEVFVSWDYPLLKLIRDYRIAVIPLAGGDYTLWFVHTHNYTVERYCETNEVPRMICEVILEDTWSED